MGTGTHDLNEFFDTLDECIKSGFDDKFVKFADYLSIARIEDTVYFNGSPASKNIDYTSDSIGTDTFEVSVGDNGIIKTVVKFTFKQFPPIFNVEREEFMPVFKNSVAQRIAAARASDTCNYLYNNDTDFGMPNDHFLFRKLGEMISCGSALKFSVAFINIKHVNQLNKYFGPDIAGTALKAFGDKINAFPDSANNEFAVHLGGDNFAAVIHTSRLPEFENYIKSVPIALAYGGDKFEHIFGCRAGITTIREIHRSGNQVMGECSQAYYYGKKNNIDIVYYSDEINEKSHNNTETLTKALNENKFLIYYQPVISLEDKPCLHAAEALARWPLDGKIMSPQEFITLATDSGIVTKIDFYVLDNVCRRIKAWQALGLAVVPITVNFSGRNLFNSSIADDILRVIDTYEVDHSLIGIEFSEPDFTQRMPILKDVSHTLSEAGVLVTLDKFSTGQSTLTLLHDIDASYVKINADRFDPEDPKGRVIANDMINLADMLGYKVICEGVETQKQADDLAMCGCKLFQSFFYDKPLSERFFLNRLENPTYNITSLSSSSEPAAEEQA